MTQVSKRYLSPNAQKRMYEILIKAISKASYSQDIIQFLTDLLSPTEQIMLAKRLAIAYLLLKGTWTHREISKILKVSVTTIQRVSFTINTGGKGYKKIIGALTRDEKIEAFIEKLTDTITSIPPTGRNWSNWRKDREDAKIKRSKAF